MTDEPCGTYRRFQQHKKAGEPVDDACREARNAYMRDVRKRHPEKIRAQTRQAKLRNQAAAILIKKHHLEYMMILTELKGRQA